MDVRRNLYHARVNRRLSLEQLGMRTALSPTVLRHIDEGRFELLPSGLYARSYVRSYAEAVGLDPDAVLADLQHLLPGAPDPIPALRASRGLTLGEQAVREVTAWMTAFHAWFAAWCARAAASLARLQPSPAAGWPGVSRDDGSALSDLRSMVRRSMGGLPARIPPPPSLRPLVNRGRHLLTGRRIPWAVIARCEAAAIDALLLLVVDSFLICLVSWSSGLPLRELIADARWAIGAFCAVPVVLYFVLFGGIAGSTLGSSICRVMRPAPEHPLRLTEILRRAVRQ